MIGNSFTRSVVQINSQEQVNGLCIDLSPDLIREVVGDWGRTPSVQSDYLLSDQLFVNRYSVHNTILGKLLLQIHHRMHSWDLKNDLLKNELFYRLAEGILADQFLVVEQLNKLDFKKNECIVFCKKNSKDLKKLIKRRGNAGLFGASHQPISQPVVKA